ncbi:MAG: ABC transporter substrate-binding protein [Okeania sp. SIO3H1]|nr:ABC transporter substrate-binding protein [Okeania sp. SIO3H1]
MIEELIEVVSKLSEASDRLKLGREERRQRIRQYFLDIEKCLRDSVERLKNGTVPNDKWGELGVYAKELPKTIGREIGQETSEALSLLLLSNSDSLPTVQDVPSIEKVAGKFKGLANTIAAQPITTQPKPNSRRKILQILTYGGLATAGFAGGVLLDKLNNPSQTATGSTIQPPIRTDLPNIDWEMHTFLGDNVRNTILFQAPDRVCDLVRKMTNNRFNIKLKRTGETEEILRKVSNGEIQCGFSGVYYSTPKYRSLFFGCAIPFGLNPQEQTAWLNYKKNPSDKYTFIQSIYKDKLELNIIPFPAAATGGQMGGWFKEEIRSIEQLEGKVIRIPGLGADVCQKAFGMTTHQQLGSISLETAIEKLKKGDFFAVEWTSPHDDFELGLHQAANFYYYPGWWEPSTTFDVQVNIDAWDNLPSSYQEIFKVACHETYMSILTEYNLKNSLALKKIEQTDVKLKRFDTNILEKAESTTKELLDLYANQDEEIFKDIYEEWLNFKSRIREWSDLNRLQ